MKLLVCGGAGFIGSNFIRYIFGKHPDWSIVNYDKLTYAGNPLNLKDFESQSRHSERPEGEKNPAKVRTGSFAGAQDDGGTKRYTIIRGDIADQEDADRVVKEYKPDAIVSFAAETHVDRSIHGSLRDFVLANVMGPQVLCETTKKYKVPLFIQVSTDEVFGALALDEKRLFHEETPFTPNMPYAACKAGGDLICRSYFQTFKTPVIVTHCSNNYGPYQFPEKFIPQTIFKALANESIPIYGDGLYVRDWIHAIDHCSALELLLTKGVPGEVYNIGADNERSNLEVVRMLLKMLGKPESLMSYVQDRPGHDRRYAIDATKIIKLGWSPEYPRDKFEEGLRKTVEWYQSNMEWVETLRGRKQDMNPHIVYESTNGIANITNSDL